MKNKLAVVMITMALFLFISFWINGGVSVATNEPHRRSQPVATRQIAYQQVLNPATATAVAAINPTATPTPSPTLIPASFAPGGENEAISSIWFSRLIGLMAFFLAAWLAHLFYQIRMYEIEKRAEIQRHEIDALAKLKINPRPILSTSISTSNTGEQVVKLNNGQEVTKLLVLEFLRAIFDENDQRGLAVSKWKASQGWSQADIENILDHLGEANIISKRQTGKACEWLTMPEKRTLAHVFRISPYELED